MCNFQAVSTLALGSHVVRIHQHHPNFVVNCRHEGCGQTFTRWKSFTQHLRRRHGELLNDFSSNSLFVMEDGDENLEEPVNKKARDETEESLIQDSQPLEWRSAEYLLRLKAEAGLTQRAVDTVVDATGSLVSTVVTALQEKILGKFEEAENPLHRGDVQRALAECCTELKDPFSKLSAVHQQEKCFRHNFHLVVIFHGRFLS